MGNEESCDSSLSIYLQGFWKILQNTAKSPFCCNLQDFFKWCIYKQNYPQFSYFGTHFGTLKPKPNFKPN